MIYRSAAQSDRRRRLTDAEWEALRERIATDDSKTVEEHCADANVTRGRFYQRYPVGSCEGEVGGEASNCQPPAGREPDHTLG